MLTPIFLPAEHEYTQWIWISSGKVRLSTSVYKPWPFLLFTLWITGLYSWPIFSIRSYISLDDVLILILSFVWLLLLVKTRALYRPMLPLFNANFLEDERYFIFEPQHKQESLPQNHFPWMLVEWSVSRVWVPMPPEDCNFFLFLFCINAFSYAAVPGLSCGTRELWSWLGHVGSSNLTKDQKIRLGPSVFRAQSLSHWTTKEFPGTFERWPILPHHDWVLIRRTGLCLNSRTGRTSPKVTTGRSVFILCCTYYLADHRIKGKPMFIGRLPYVLGFPGGSDSDESTCSARDPCSIPWSGRSPGEGNGNPLQYSCLGNPRDRGTWQNTGHRVADSQTHLSS